MTRYQYNMYRDTFNVMNDDLNMLEYNSMEYFLDEMNNTLNIREKVSKKIIMAIDKNGQVAIRVPIDWGRRSMIEMTTASLLGFRVISVYRYGKYRMYVYPDTEYRYVSWDSEPSLIKYVIDDDAKVVVLDIHGVPIMGAKLQKSSSNNRKPKVGKTAEW